MRKPRTKRTNTKANWRAELQAMNERLPKQLALRDKILAQTEAFLRASASWKRWLLSKSV